MKLVFNVTLSYEESKLNLSTFKILIDKLLKKLPINSVKIVINSRRTNLEIIQDSELSANDIFKGTVQNEDILKTVIESGHQTLIFHVCSIKSINWDSKINIISETEGLIESFNIADLNGNWIIDISKVREYVPDKKNGILKTVLDILNQIRVHREYFLQRMIPFNFFHGVIPAEKKNVKIATVELYNEMNTAHNISNFLFKTKNKKRKKGKKGTENKNRNFDLVTNWKNKKQFFQRKFMGHLMLFFMCLFSMVRFMVIFLRTVYTKSLVQFMIAVFRPKIYKIFLVFYLFGNLVKIKWLCRGYSCKTIMFGYVMSMIIQFADPFLLGEHLFMMLLNKIF